MWFEITNFVLIDSLALTDEHEYNRMGFPLVTEYGVWIFHTRYSEEGEDFSTKFRQVMKYGSRMSMLSKKKSMELVTPCHQWKLVKCCVTFSTKKTRQCFLGQKRGNFCWFHAKMHYDRCCWLHLKSEKMQKGYSERKKRNFYFWHCFLCDHFGFLFHENNSDSKIFKYFFLVCLG